MDNSLAKVFDDSPQSLDHKTASTGTTSTLRKGSYDSVSGQDFEFIDFPDDLLMSTDQGDTAG
jgi:hypothetical protein